MYITVILAQILGIVFVVLGLSMIFQKHNTAAVLEELVQNKSFMWMGGLMALMIGAVIVVFNNYWNSGLSVLVSVIGWLALMKGVFLLVFPKTAVPFYKKYNKGNFLVITGVIVFVLGLLLLF